MGGGRAPEVDMVWSGVWERGVTYLLGGGGGPGHGDRGGWESLGG